MLFSRGGNIDTQKSSKLCLSADIQLNMEGQRVADDFVSSGILRNHVLVVLRLTELSTEKRT